MGRRWVSVRYAKRIPRENWNGDARGHFGCCTFDRVLARRGYVAALTFPRRMIRNQAVAAGLQEILRACRLAVDTQILRDFRPAASSPLSKAAMRVSSGHLQAGDLPTDGRGACCRSSGETSDEARQHVQDFLLRHPQAGDGFRHRPGQPRGQRATRLNFSGRRSSCQETQLRRRRD
jgi:hypothetical protein